MKVNNKLFKKSLSPMFKNCKAGRILGIVVWLFLINSLNAQNRREEKLPEFKGGPVNLLHCIQDSMIYPRDAYRNGIGGTVYVRFVIDTLGRARDITIAKGVREDLDNEAQRIVDVLPFWIPGEQQGKKVPVMMTLPVIFDPRMKVKVEPRKKRKH